MATFDLGMVTAYAYAVAGGYTGTEAEFEELLGNIADDLSEIENLSVTVSTLPAGSSATASYSSGVLSLGIPKGDKGDKGNKGDQGIQGLTGNGIDNIAKTSTSGNVDTYTITYTDGTTTTFEVTNGAVTSVDGQTGDVVLNHKANIDGAYESMTVGNAEQLVSTVMVEDSEPYNFRTSGGTADIGNREYDEIVGGTVAWNQMVNNVRNGSGGAIVVDGDVTTISAFTARYPYINSNTFHTVVGHKYLVWADIKYTGTITESVWMYLSNRVTQWGHRAISPSDSQNTWIHATEIYAPNVAEMDNSFIKFQYNGADYANLTSISVKNTVCIDLTQLFGSTIADYIYSLEQANPGAGVAWFKKLFPKDYYEYNAGELISVNTSGHNTVGFNAYDNSTGKAMVVGGQQYEVVGTYTSLSLDGDAVTVTGGMFTPSKSGELTVTGGDSTTCIHLVWSGYRNGEYEPYVKHEYPLDNSLTLRGIPKLDASNSLYYDGDTYESDGTVTRKYGVVDLGSLNWAFRNDTVTYFYASLTIASHGSWYNTLPPIICSKYVTALRSDVTNGKVVISVDGILGSPTSSQIQIYDPAYTDVATFQASMSGVYLVYELATPTTETAEPYQNPQIVDDFGTEEYVDERAVAIPVGHNTNYPANLRDKLQHLPDLAVSDGYYMINQANNTMTLEQFRIPKAPTTDGTYTLKATVSGGTPTYTWEVEE